MLRELARPLVPVPAIFANVGTGVLVKVGATLDSCMSPVAQFTDGI
jgi:hypothetical protein